MPQPLRKYCEMNFTPNSVTERPALAGKFALVVALSAQLENRLAALLSILCGSNAETTMAMFMAVNSSDAQRAMLRAAAESVLTGHELEQFGDLMDEFRTRYRERNKIVHGLWAASSSHPNALLLARASDFAGMWKRVAVLAATNAPPPDNILDGVWQNVMVYREKDFDDVVLRLTAFDAQIMNFWESVFHRMVGIEQEESPEQPSLLPVGSTQNPPSQEG
jgi:hypothetical protein